MYDLLWVSFAFVSALRLLKFIYHWWAVPEVRDLEKYGKWVVVTGATDGIGRAFADNFAEKGMNVVLVSRNQEKLETVAKEIETQYKVSTQVIQADFSSLDEKMYARIETALQDLDIGVLVNNVGVSYTHPEYFMDLATNHANLYNDIINCNINSTVNMCRFVLPGMVSRGRGWIINVSSGLADIPAPLLTLYAASKSFISKFSHDLGTEYDSKGIKVQWLKPGLVATNMSAIKKTSWLAPSPKVYVKSALYDLNMKKCSEGYFTHILYIKAILIVAWLLPDFVAKKVLATNLGTKKKAMKKCKNCQVAVKEE